MRLHVALQRLAAPVLCAEPCFARTCRARGYESDRRSPLIYGRKLNRSFRFYDKEKFKKRGAASVTEAIPLLEVLLGGFPFKKSRK